MAGQKVIKGGSTTSVTSCKLAQETVLPRVSILPRVPCFLERRVYRTIDWFSLVYWGLTPQQQPGSYQGGEMMMKSVFWWRKPEYAEETTDLRQVTDDTVLTTVSNRTIECGNKRYTLLYWRKLRMFKNEV